MSYVAKILQPGETLVYVTQPHWLLYMPAIVLAMLAVALAALSTQLGPDSTFFALIGAAIVAAVALGAWLRGFIGRRATELAVTDRRVVYKRGLFRRHTIEMNMDKVESVNVDQSVAGRIFNYGTVTIHGTGGGIEPMTNIENPLAFRNHVTGM